MTFILIQNDGEIESNAFELIGASTKRDDSEKIGFFGSGLKYSVAYMMRRRIPFRVFSGLNELEFSTTSENLKNQVFERICINGKPTSYTVTMGPTWTEDWFVLREIYCNALDEGSCRIETSVETIEPTSGQTRIYIEATPQLTAISKDWDAYFSTKRTPLYSMPSVYTGSLGLPSYQPVEMFRKTQGAIYRKGIRVALQESALYDYGFQDVYINEDRTARSTWALTTSYANLMALCPGRSYVINVLRTANATPCSEYNAIKTQTPRSTFSDEWLTIGKKYCLAVEERAGAHTSDIYTSRSEVLLMPQLFAKELNKQLPQISILGLSRTVNDIGIRDTEVTDRMTHLLQDILTCLKKMKYSVEYPINIVEFDNDDILGNADTEHRTIYLAAKLFDLGRKEIAMTVMEECEHLHSGCSDETRAFQNHLIRSWLTMMETVHDQYL